MTWRRHCVRDGVAPSANELAWFYMGSDSVTRKAFPMRKAKLRSVSFPIQRTRVTRVTRDVLLAWSVADFSSCQGNNSIKNKLILSVLNCKIVFCSISLTTMFTNKAQASRLTQFFSAGSSKFYLSVVFIWRKSKSKRNKSIIKSHDSFELHRADRLSAP